MTVLPAFEQAGQSFCVPSMALILLVQVQSRVFTAKCSEPQVGISNGMDGGSGVAKFLSLLNNPMPVSLLSGDRKPQIRFLGNHNSGSGNLYHKSFRM